MMCPKCGNDMLFSDEYKTYFCPNCGMKLCPVQEQPSASAETPPEEVDEDELVEASSFDAPYQSFARGFGIAAVIVFIIGVIVGIILIAVPMSSGSRLLTEIIFAILCVVWDILIICFICGLIVDKYHRTRMVPVIKKIEELENKLAEVERTIINKERS